MSDPGPDPGTDAGGEPIEIGRLALIALFVTALITAQVTASKLILLKLPVSMPVVGNSLILPGAAVAIAVTFFATDCYAELYGPRSAHLLVNVAFFMNFVLLGLIYTTIWAPALPNQPVSPSAYAAVLTQSTNIVIASLGAYLVSQNWDVAVFHALREYTDGAHLWFRNIGSTATSQLLDTVIFVSMGFWIVPQWLGGPVRPFDVILALIVGQYLLKLAIAILDTPFVYLVVGGLRRLPHAIDSDPA